MLVYCSVCSMNGACCKLRLAQWHTSPLVRAALHNWNAPNMTAADNPASTCTYNLDANIRENKNCLNETRSKEQAENAFQVIALGNG